MMLGSRAMRLGLPAMLAYSAGSVGAGAFFAFNNFVIPLLLSSMNAPDLLIGLLSSTRSIEGVIVQPTRGAWSDRQATPLGRRRPFLLVAIPLSALFLFLAPFANTLVQVAVAIFLFSIFFNVAVDPYAALLPDITPADQRGTLSGISNGIQLVSQVAFLIVVSIAASSGAVPLWTFGFCGAVLLASFAVTIRFVHEPRQLAERAAHLPLRAYLETLVRNGQALRYLGTIFVYQFGLSAVIPFLPLFITKDLGQSNEIAIALSALTLLVTAASAIAFGAAADRVGHRTVLGVGWTILAVAALGGTVIRFLPETIAVVVLAGIGNGAAAGAAARRRRRGRAATAVARGLGAGQHRTRHAARARGRAAEEVGCDPPAGPQRLSGHDRSHSSRLPAVLARGLRRIQSRLDPLRHAGHKDREARAVPRWLRPRVRRR